MVFCKSLFFLLLNIAIKTVNLLGILLTILLSIILYIIISEVPITFFNKYIEEYIFHNLVKVEKINFKWDYNIKKPLLVITNVNYSNPQNNLFFKFNYLGISFDIKKLLTNHKFYPVYMYIEGFNIYAIRNKNNNLTFDIDKTKDTVIHDFFSNIESQHTSIEVKQSRNKSSFLDKLSIDEVNKRGIYNVIVSLKKQYEVLSFLNMIDINRSNIFFKDYVTSKGFVANINNINISYNANSNKIFLKSTANIEDILLNKTINIKGNIEADDKKNLFFNYTLENISPEIILLYSNTSLDKKVLTAGLNINVNLEGRYQFPLGLKSYNADIFVDEGELFIKDLLLDKLKISTIKTQLTYNASSGKVNIPYFNINFSDKNTLKPLWLNGGIVKIKNVQLKSNIDLNNKLYNFTDIKINLLDKIFIGDVNVNKDNASFKLHSTDVINISDVKNIWPKSYLPNIKNWVINKVQKGVINKIQLDGSFSLHLGKVALNNIYGTVLASNLEVMYLDGLPLAVAPKAILEFDDKHLNIKYFEAKTGNIKSKSGEITICDEFTNKKKFYPILKVASKAESTIIDGLSYINSKPLNVLDKIKLDAKRFKGDIAGNIYLEYSFYDKKIKNLDVNLSGHDISFKNAFKNKDVTNANLNITVKNKTLVTYGTGKYYGMPVNIYVDTNWDPRTDYSLKLNIDSKNVPVDKIRNLNLVPMLLNDKLKGYLDLSAEVLQLKKSNRKIVVTNLDLTNTSIDSLPYINYSKKMKEALNVILNLDFTNNKLMEIKQLSLTNKTLSVQMKVALNDDKSMNIVINNFIMDNKANIKGYLYLSDSSFNVNITGKYLNLEWVKSGLSKDKISPYNNQKQEDYLSNKNKVHTLPKSTDYCIKASIKQVESNKVFVNNFYTNIDYLSNNLSSLVISGDLSDNDTVNIVYDKSNGKIVYNISNLGEALKFLKLYTKIKSGSLNGQINYNKDRFNNILTDGVVLIQSFNLGVIPFSSARIAFTSMNYDFNIMSIVMQGNVVGGTLSGTYKVKDDYLFLTGYITPIWSTSHLLVNIPILGDFLKSNFAQFFLSGGGVNTNDKASKVNQGAVNIPFSIYGNINNLQYTFSKLKKGNDRLLEEFNGNLINPSYYTDSVYSIFEFKDIK